MDEKYIEMIIETSQSTKSAHKRLDEHEEQIKELSNVYVALTKVDDKVTNVEKNVSEIKQDLKDIKEKPIKNWDNLIKVIITRNCYSSFGLFFSKIWIVGWKEGK